MKYLTNRWYAAGWSSEAVQAPIVRQLLDQPVMLYRTDEGAVVAMSDKCPHRFAPLHQGKRVGAAIRCPYHGLLFGPDGICIENPIGKGIIPEKARLRTYPVVERNGIIWLWFGPDLPDERKIPDFAFLDEADRYDFVDGYMIIDANYALLSDNLLDLSHAEFLHPNLANPGANKRVRSSVEQNGETVHALNARPNEPPTAMLRLAMGDKAGDVVNMWSNVRWNPPAALIVEVGGTALGEAKENGVNTLAAHLITPATMGTSHYFWKMGRTFFRNDAAFGNRLREMITDAFTNEDKPIIEAQQHYIGTVDLADMDPVYLQGDGAALRARHMMNRLLEDGKGEAVGDPDRLDMY